MSTVTPRVQGHSVTPTYNNHRFPPEIISHAVWLYFRFSLSYRDVEGLLFERDIVVTYEAIRKWCRKFGQSYANQLRRRRPQPGDKWFLDEVFLTINGTRHYLCGPWIRTIMSSTSWCRVGATRKQRRSSSKKLLKGLQYVPRMLITDKLKSYAAAKREIIPGVEHRQSRYLNNRYENSQRPTRERERRMQRFEAPGHAQRFLFAYGLISQHFRPRRHLHRADEYRREMTQRFEVWWEVTGLVPAA